MCRTTISVAPPEIIMQRCCSTYGYGTELPFGRELTRVPCALHPIPSPLEDPMVDVMGVMGDRTGISSFYISFVLAPLASNASELIAAFNYSLKKTSRTIVISFAALQVRGGVKRGKRFRQTLEVATLSQE